MPKKILSAQKPFKMLVPAIRGGSDPSRGTSGNPVKKRSTVEQQYFTEIARPGNDMINEGKTPGIGTKIGLMSGDPQAGATGTITVDAGNSFTGPTIVILGQYSLSSAEDWAVGANSGLTAASLQSAIDELPGWSATVLGSEVTVTGPNGPGGNLTVFDVTGASPQTLTLSPSTGRLSSGTPTLGPVSLS